MGNEDEQPVDPMTVGQDDERRQLESFLESYRQHLPATLDGLTEEEARRRLVPSQTTLLGLVKHAVFMQTVWFGEAVTGIPRTELGVADHVDDSFVLTEDDTVAGVREAFAVSCADARQRVAGRSLDDVVDGHPRIGPITLRWVHLQCLKELAHHSGHADILREQVLAARRG